MEPSRFYRQHHAVEAPAIDDLEFRPFYRIRSRLDQLLIDGAISYPQWRAAQAFRTLAERVLRSTWRTKWIDQPHGRSGFDRSLAARHDAITRLADIHRKLGSFAFDLIEAHAVEDQSWRQLGARLGVRPRTARAWTILALQALGAVWRGA